MYVTMWELMSKIAMLISLKKDTQKAVNEKTSVTPQSLIMRH